MLVNERLLQIEENLENDMNVLLEELQEIKASMKSIKVLHKNGNLDDKNYDMAFDYLLMQKIQIQKAHETVMKAFYAINEIEMNCILEKTFIKSA